MSRVAGAVLTGGSSRRMGRDKALVEIGGRPLATIAAEALRSAGVGPVVGVGGDGAGLGAWGLGVIDDLHPGEGPLGGLLTALRWAPHETVVVLSCDLPTIGAADVAGVLGTLTAHASADVAAPIVDGRPQFLVAAYRRASLTGLRACFDSGQRSVRRAIEEAGLLVALADDLDAAHLVDVDTPADLARAARAAGQHGRRR